jgi:hypothetical protein
MNVKRHETPLVALLSVGWERDDWRAFPDGNSFRWHIVGTGPTKRQARELWISEAVAAVVFVGPGQAMDRAIELLHLLRGTGPPVLVAIAEPTDVQTERLLRQTGAIYLCGPEARQRLVDVLREPLCKASAVK